MKEYDVIIIGGGVTGTAILYTLSKYTNIKKIALIEKREDVARVQSSKDNNSQTLHFGDIETNYTVEKARKVKEGADLLKAYVDNNKERKLHKKFHKMVLGVGSEEVHFLKKRHENFKELFPKLKLINSLELKKLEPNLIKKRKEKELVALFSEDGYAVDYEKLSKSFVQDSKIKKSDLYFNSKVNSIIKQENEYLIKTNKESFKAKFVVVAASANSLTFAHRMGLKKNLILLPVMGEFFSSPKKVNGKVYMVQDPKLPFAAVHADPDVSLNNITRYGPVAKILPVLEKRNIRSFFDFLKLFNFKLNHAKVLFNIVKDPTYFKFTVTNMSYALPIIGKYFFLKEARKIIPSLKYTDLKFERKIGGIRPQIVDTNTGKIELGEAKIKQDNILFNITPSPGASVCLQNALVDSEFISSKLNASFDKDKFLKDHRAN
jgi:malate dehydrogenase (quinone)